MLVHYQRDTEESRKTHFFPMSNAKPENAGPHLHYKFTPFMAWKVCVVYAHADVPSDYIGISVTRHYLQS